jgi:hypothetical protein
MRATRESLRRSLDALETTEDVDLVCAPDLSLTGEEFFSLQCEVLRHCYGMHDGAHRSPVAERFAILDSRSWVGGGAAQQEMVRHWQALSPTAGALYFPWIRVSDGPESTGGFVPPCGHIAGIYARLDSRVGTHKAPANEVVEGAIDLDVRLSDRDLGQLNEAGVNCIRAIHGRGIRVWGARTLSGLPQWRYVNVQRMFIGLVRWIDHACRDLVFEPNDPALWHRIHDRLSGQCQRMFDVGALKGRTPAEAFYVKCDAEINPRVKGDAGEVISEVGLAPVVPAEFIVVRITHSPNGSAFTIPAMS